MKWTLKSSVTNLDRALRKAAKSGDLKTLEELHASLSEAHRTKAESLLTLEGAHEGGGGVT